MVEGKNEDKPDKPDFGVPHFQKVYPGLEYKYISV